MNKTSRAILIALAAINLLGAERLLAASATRSVAPMQAHAADPREPRPRDRSILIRNDAGVVAKIRTSNLDPATYTVWWVVFNHPEFCADLPCTSGDLPGNGGDARIEASALYADGNIVGPHGRGRFIAGLAIGETKDALFGPGLLDPRGAEVHLVIRTHGPEVLEVLHEQITTPSGGCPPGGCTDQQFTVHLP